MLQNNSNYRIIRYLSYNKLFRMFLQPQNITHINYKYYKNNVNGYNIQQIYNIFVHTFKRKNHLILQGLKWENNFSFHL